jgi:glycosyltransferase involved in cell wall biosynthesis
VSRPWAILTGEYPPQPGGVADYTQQVAHALAVAGDTVTVFAPPIGPKASEPGLVAVVRLPDHFGPRGLLALTRHLRRLGRPRVLVQYVPHAFGWRALNVLFASWLASSRYRHEVLFHEVAIGYEPGQSRKHRLLAGITQMHAALIARTARRVFVSIPAWGEWLARLSPRASAARWVPIPSNVPTQADPVAVRAVQARYPGPLVGHLGTYGPFVAPLVRAALPGILAEASAQILLLGRGSAAMAARWQGELGHAERIHAADDLPPAELAAHLAACTVLLQPFADGISTRRTSAMAGVALGVPTVTNAGFLTEPLWRERQAVAFAPLADLAATVRRALTNANERAALSTRARALYAERFALAHTIRALRSLE